MAIELTSSDEGFSFPVAISTAGSFEAQLKSYCAALKPTQPVRTRQFNNNHDWLAAFQDWVDKHRDVTAIADDSRESIY
jgi:hypothetical protein